MGIPPKYGPFNMADRNVGLVLVSTVLAALRVCKLANTK